MKGIWSDFASKMLKEIYLYYKVKSSNTIANRIKNDIFSATKQLHQHPYSGTKEPLLEKLEQNHRYLVHKNYKIYTSL